MIFTLDRVAVAQIMTVDNGTTTSVTATTTPPWTGLTEVRVGYSRQGTLTVEPGGSVGTATGYVGYNSGSSGIVNVNESEWTTSGSLYLGFLEGSQGQLNVNDGNVKADIMDISRMGTGKAVINGSRAILDVDSTLIVAGGSSTATSAVSGMLEIRGGSTVKSGSGFIGSNHTAEGNVVVEGAGSSWTLRNLFGVAGSGRAVVEIMDGGKIESGAVQIGIDKSASGNVRVDGTGSVFRSNAYIVAGGNGVGRLSISGGGAASATDIYAGYSIDINRTGGHLPLHGEIIVSGRSSSLESDSLAIGHSTHGSLAVDNGATVQSGTAAIGVNNFLAGTGTTGTATVRGTGSQWTISTARLYIGVLNGGTGILGISEGGVVSSPGRVTIAQEAGSTGTLNIGAAAGEAAVLPGILAVPGVEFGAGTGSLVFNHTDMSGGYEFASVITGAGKVITFSGTSVLTGTNNYTAGTFIYGGVLQIGNGGTTGSITGPLLNHATLAFNRSDTTTFAQAIPGTGGVLKLGTGAVVLTGINTYSGGTVIKQGTLTGSIKSFGTGNIETHATLVIDQPVDASFARSINGSGLFVKRGAGHLDLTGDSRLSGMTIVEAGKLSINGTLAPSAVTVFDGAVLGGTGTVGSVVARSGAVIAPGNSVGTLTVVGDLVLAAGSVYAVELAGDGHSDRIAVGGVATVSGSRIAVTALDPQTSYINDQRYTVITATGGVEGDFSGFVSSPDFLDLSIEQLPGQVDLVIKVKGGAASNIFQQVARTPNQRAAASGASKLPQSGKLLGLYNRLLMLDEVTAREAFDNLSGEIHASAKTIMIDESWILRHAVNTRMRTASASARSHGAWARNTDYPDFWGYGYGVRNLAGGNYNTAKATDSTGGFFIGADKALSEALRIGAVAGYSHSEFDVKRRNSSGESDNYHLGLYSVWTVGALNLRSGATHSWHDISTRRNVVFRGFGDNLTAAYDMGTTQLFGEAGYSFDMGPVALEPYSGLAYVRLDADGFMENGEAAALAGYSAASDLGYATFGLRGSNTLDVYGMALVLRGGLALRNTLGGVDPDIVLSFARTSDFLIKGVPIARNTALIEAGIGLAVSRNVALDLSYAGQMAGRDRDHAIKGVLTARF